jgi:hypothetical protein
MRESFTWLEVLMEKNAKAGALGTGGSGREVERAQAAVTGAGAITRRRLLQIGAGAGLAGAALATIPRATTARASAAQGASIPGAVT